MYDGNTQVLVQVHRLRRPLLTLFRDATPQSTFDNTLKKGKAQAAKQQKGEEEESLRMMEEAQWPAAVSLKAASCQISAATTTTTTPRRSWSPSLLLPWHPCLPPSPTSPLPHRHPLLLRAPSPPYRSTTFLDSIAPTPVNFSVSEFLFWSPFSDGNAHNQMVWMLLLQTR